MKNSYVLLFLCISIAIGNVFSMFFLVNTRRQCFTIEQPRDIPIVFGYEFLDAGSVVDIGIYYGALALSEMQISNKTVSEPVGHLDFVTDNDGYYSICLKKSDQTKALLPLRVKLSINYGYDSEYYEKLMRDQKFDSINMEVHKLNDLMIMTLNEADYQKHKEVDYHFQTEQMDTATLWWPVLQIGILVVTGIFQVQHLKLFFKSNKLI